MPGKTRPIVPGKEVAWLWKTKSDGATLRLPSVRWGSLEALPLLGGFIVFAFYEVVQALREREGFLVLCKMADTGRHGMMALLLLLGSLALFALGDALCGRDELEVSAHHIVHRRMIFVSLRRTYIPLEAEWTVRKGILSQFTLCAEWRQEGKLRRTLLGWGYSPGQLRAISEEIAERVRGSSPVRG